jgi:hypothetical protein
MPTATTQQTLAIVKALDAIRLEIRAASFQHAEATTEAGQVRDRADFTAADAITAAEDIPQDNERHLPTLRGSTPS